MNPRRVISEEIRSSPLKPKTAIDALSSGPLLSSSVSTSVLIEDCPWKWKASVTKNSALSFVESQLFAHGGSFQAPNPRSIVGFKLIDLDLPEEEGTEEKWKATAELPPDTAPGENDVGKVFAIHFEKVAVLRRKCPDLFRFIPKVSEQLEVMELLRDHFHAKLPGSREPNTLYAYYGCSADVAERIMKYGFADLGKDEGWFGAGIYLTLNAEYACQNAAGYHTPSGTQPPKPHPKHPSRFAVILCAVCVGMAYPITPTSEDYPNPPRPDGHSKYCGQRLKVQFDAHFAVVHESKGYEAVEVGMAQYGQLVLHRHSSVYPMAILWVEEV